MLSEASIPQIYNSGRYSISNSLPSANKFFKLGVLIMYSLSFNLETKIGPRSNLLRLDIYGQFSLTTFQNKNYILFRFDKLRSKLNKC